MLRPSATRGGYDGRALRTPLVRSLRLLTPSLARAADGGLSPDRRREVRRGLHFGCRVLCADGLKLVADRGLDLSPEGVLVLSDERVVCGAKLVVSFMATDFAIWFDTAATVARIAEGRRPGDTGRALGLHFQPLPALSRLMLRGYLHKLPRPIPQRDRPPDWRPHCFPSGARIIRDIAPERLR